MRTSYHQFCAVARTLDAIGSRWTLLVVRELVLRGPLTAAAIGRGLPDVPPNQLAERLVELEALGVVRRALEPGRMRRYELTEKGDRLGAVLDSLAEFGLSELAAEPAPDEALLPHVLMRQLELRYGARCADAGVVDGRFELEIADPDALWSLEPGAAAPRRWALHAGPDGLRVRAGACLDADARVRMTASSCAGLVAGRRPPPEALHVTGAADKAAALLDLLAPPPAVAAAA
ncbi:MAG TPA: helix-turn-helix domain-containing protein [Solirubrobacteraceae bacterium]|nr:helix-turn-helix domain-containing protein [Solirubrobacteraceae bacterium]